MTISAISNLVAAIGGKAALPGLGEILPDGGLPPDFAALLAEQIPAAVQSDPALLAVEGIAASTKPDSELLGQIISRTIMAQDNKGLPAMDKPADVHQDTKQGAEDILAALSPSSGQPDTSGLPASARSSTDSTIVEPDGSKGSDDKDRNAASISDPIPTDPGMAAQYVVPQVVPPVQNRLADRVDRDKPVLPEQTSKTGNSETSSKEGRSSQAEQANSALPIATPTLPASTSLAAKAGESRIIPRADTANTAILAGDSNPGNSGNTPAFASALAAASAAGATATSAPPTQAPAINTALGSPNWPQDFGSRVVWLAKNDLQVAHININPPQLGPVQISISINGDQATTTFASPHAEVRQAIQDSLPQLREMLSSAGISLGQANVGSQLPSQNREAAFQFANEARSSGETAILSPDSHTSASSAGTPVHRGRGLVDLFA